MTLHLLKSPAPEQLLAGCSLVLEGITLLSEMQGGLESSGVLMLAVLCERGVRH